jgi:hypothetical protein
MRYAIKKAEMPLKELSLQYYWEITAEPETNKGIYSVQCLLPRHFS